MMKILYSLLTLFMLGACSLEENIESTEKESLKIDDIEIPNTIFISEKSNSVIEIDEMKQGIKVYLDSSEELYKAVDPFQESIYEGHELSSSDLDKFNKINTLVHENDENFSNFISNNTLPEGYKEESLRISQYISSSNQYLYELDEILDGLVNKLSEGKVPTKEIDLVFGKNDIVNGREQKKIEQFLDKEDIQTKAFGRK
ncbi:NDxxF motif lipoprotein [Bacillus sp. JCM 19041]|uniref:NDxxF motif lipoprotein n=1 Tax=Bacillus sp. JCM 19041 TaxID=1460637 RepID=UPI0006D108AF